MRVLFGLERLPRSVAFDDPRLPGVELGAEKLRLNSETVPAAVLAGAADGHAARLAALLGWLQAQCGDYAVRPRVVIAAYLDWVEAAVEARCEALEAALSRYAGLYRAEDWVWSALRPLPRAWAMGADGPVRHALAFWDGAGLVGVEAAMADGAFWAGELLPRSPFRRAALSLQG